MNAHAQKYHAVQLPGTILRHILSAHRYVPVDAFNAAATLVREKQACPQLSLYNSHIIIYISQQCVVAAARHLFMTRMTLKVRLYVPKHLFADSNAVVTVLIYMLFAACLWHIF